MLQIGTGMKPGGREEASMEYPKLAAPAPTHNNEASQSKYSSTGILKASQFTTTEFKKINPALRNSNNNCDILS